MIQRITFLAAAILVALTAACMEAQPTDATGNVDRVDTIDRLELDVLAELNAVRTDPDGWADRLEKRLRYFDGKIYRPPTGTAVMTTEGTAAVKEAIDVLRAQRPLGTLSYSSGLSAAARDHARDTGPSGGFGHTGSDGSQPVDRMKRHGALSYPAGENIVYGPTTAEDIVAAWLIEDGVPSRGHRDIIFTEGFRACGIAYAPHATYKQMCVAEFAGGFEGR